VLRSLTVLPWRKEVVRREGNEESKSALGRPVAEVGNRNQEENIVLEGIGRINR